MKLPPFLYQPKPLIAILGVFHRAKQDLEDFIEHHENLLKDSDDAIVIIRKEQADFLDAKKEAQVIHDNLTKLLGQ